MNAMVVMEQYSEVDLLLGTARRLGERAGGRGRSRLLPGDGVEPDLPVLGAGLGQAALAAHLWVLLSG